MKPSQFHTVIGRKALFLLPGFSCLTWKGYAYCKLQKDVDEINSSPNINSRLESHETIHIRQAQSINDSWTRFYITYIWEWLKNLPLIFISIYAPYKFMPMEMEAYLNQDDWDYCMHDPTTKWKQFERLSLKTRRRWAKEYYKAKPRPYFRDFLQEHLYQHP